MQIQLSIYDLKGETCEEIERTREERERLARRLPGLKMLLTGSLRSGLESWGQDRQLPGAGDDLVPGWGEVLVFNSDAAAGEAFASLAGRDFAEHSRARLRNLRSFAAHGQAVIAFDGRKAGARCRVSIAGLVFDSRYGSLEHAEHHYVGEHSRLAGRLPGCRAYFIGIVEHGDKAVRQPSDPHRLAMAVFDDEASLSQALASPEGAELNRDAQGFARVALLYFLDAGIGL
jgi:uncharacterized protein (TIGR02118 family)